MVAPVPKNLPGISQSSGSDSESHEHNVNVNCTCFLCSRGASAKTDQKMQVQKTDEKVKQVVKDKKCCNIL